MDVKTDIINEFNLEEELAKLPKAPGVYIMHDKTEGILYVGKAKVLHNRVRQYFRKGYGHNNSGKIKRMVSQVAYFEYIVTKTEVEALVLECNLIKKHRPKYNTLMTDDKGYPYIKVFMNEDFPRLIYSHSMKKDKAKYYGPFINRASVKMIIELLNKSYGLRFCQKKINYDNRTDRPCLYYQMGMCTGACGGKIDADDYMARLEKAITFLNGNSKELRSELVERMKAYSEELEFEKAGEIRDLIKCVDEITDKQMVSHNDKDNRDMIAVARGENDTVVTTFIVRDGKLIGRENHHMNVNIEDSDSEILEEFIKQFYMGVPYVPREICVNVELEEATLIEEFLGEIRGAKTSIIVPQKGDKKKLLDMALDNANLVLSQDMERIKRKEKRTSGACQEIAEKIGIKKATRMEAFDISHIGGTLTVASMVVFENGEPKKNAYRKFKLQSIAGPDDYGSMKEVLSRRYTNENLGPLPDVIMMDGGKGQINVAKMVLDSLGIDIPVCGMVKNDKHQTRALIYEDEEILFDKSSDALLMVTALQDEAHRFAISYHRSLRGKNQIKSILDGIPGVGEKKKAALIAYFGSPNVIKDAGTEELVKVDGINESLANVIYEYFHS